MNENESYNQFKNFDNNSSPQNISMNLYPNIKNNKYKNTSF